MSTAPAPSATIGAQLKAAIVHQQLSAYAVARRADVDPRAVQRWLAGERDITLETADRIGRALGVRLVEGTRRRARVEVPVIAVGDD